jgi:hypothetical protein
MKAFAIAALATSALVVESVAMAGSPHFVALSAEAQGDTIYVAGKEAGLGDESQVHIVVSAEAACINPGDKHPKAANKESFSAAGDFPAQNGKANFSLTLTASFQPNCSPPMEVVWSSVTVTDTTNGISQSFSGPF